MNGAQTAHPARSRRRALIGALLGVAAALLVFLIYFAVNAPQSSGVEITRCLEANGACIQFPSVAGTNLNGVEVALPDDFAGAVNLVIVSFEEEQTARAAAWLPLARELAADYPRFAYYSVPVLPTVNALLRGVIMGGMLVLIPDEDVRAVTVMLFLDDVDTFLSALAIPDRAALQLVVVNADGSIHWRIAGDYTEEAANALRIVLARALR